MFLFSCESGPFTCTAGLVVGSTFLRRDGSQGEEEGGEGGRGVVGSDPADGRQRNREPPPPDNPLRQLDSNPPHPLSRANLRLLF